MKLSKKFIFTILFLVFILVVLAGILIVGISNIGLAREAVIRSQQKPITPLIEIRPEELFQPNVTKKYVLDGVQINEINEIPPSILPSDDKLIITINDFNFSKENIIKEDFNVSYYLNKDAQDKKEFCLIDPFIYSYMNDIGETGGPINYSYSFNQLLPSDKKIKSVDIYYYNKRNLFSSCILAPTGSFLNESKYTYYFEDLYKTNNNYSQRISFVDYFELYGFNIFNYNLKPIEYVHEKKELNLYDIKIIIHLQEKTHYVFDPGLSQIDTILNYLSHTDSILIPEYNYNMTPNLETMLFDYPNIDSGFLSSSENRNTLDYSDHYIVVGHLESGENIDDLIDVVGEYFNNANFITMNQIINHDWKISSHIPNFDNLNEDQKDKEVCKFFYNSDLLQNQKDMRYDPAAKFDDYVTVDISFGENYYEEPEELFSTAGMMELGDNSIGMPLTLDCRMNCPYNTVVELFYVYKNNQRFIQEQNHYGPESCLGSFTAYGWEPINPSGADPVFSNENKEWKHYIIQKKIPLHYLDSALNCLDRFRNVVQVKIGRAFILNPNTRLYYQFFGEYTQDPEKWFLINKQQYMDNLNLSESQFNYCLSSHGSYNKNFGPFSLNEIMGKDFRDSLCNYEKQFLGSDGYCTYSLSEEINDICNSKYIKWDEETMGPAPLNLPGHLNSILDWCEVGSTADEENYIFLNSNFLRCINNQIDEDKNKYSFEYYQNNNSGDFYCNTPYFSKSPSVKLRNFIKYANIIGLDEKQINDFILLGDADRDYLASEVLSNSNDYAAVPFKNLFPETERRLVSDTIKKIKLFSLVWSHMGQTNSKKTSFSSTSLFGLNYYFNKELGMWVYGTSLETEEDTDHEFFAIAAKYCDPFQKTGHYSDQNYSVINPTNFDLLYGPGVRSIFGTKLDSNNDFIMAEYPPVPSDYYYRSLFETNYNINYCSKETITMKLNKDDSKKLYEQYYRLYSDIYNNLENPQNVETDIIVSCNTCVLRTGIGDSNSTNPSQILLPKDHVFGIIENRDDLENVQKSQVNVSRLPISNIDNFNNWVDNINLFKEKINSDASALTKPMFYVYKDETTKEDFYGWPIYLYRKSPLLYTQYNSSKFNTPYFFDLSTHSLVSDYKYLDILLLYQKYFAPNLVVMNSHGYDNILAETRLDRTDIHANKFQDIFPSFYIFNVCNAGNFTNFYSSKSCEPSLTDCSPVEVGLFNTKLMAGAIAPTGVLFGLPNYDFDYSLYSKINFFEGNNKQNNYRFQNILKFYFDLYNDKSYIEPLATGVINNIYSINHFGDPRLNLNFNTNNISRDYQLDLTNTTVGNYTFENGLSLPSKTYTLNVRRQNKDSMYMVKAFFCAATDYQNPVDYENFSCGQYGDTRNSLQDNFNCIMINPSVFETNLIPSGWNDQILKFDEQFFSEYSNYNDILNNYPETINHFSVHHSYSGILSRCFGNNINNNQISKFNTKLSELDDMGILFYDSDFSRNSANTTFAMTISTNQLNNILDSAISYFNNNNIDYDRIHQVFTVESLGSSTNIFSNYPKSSECISNFGYYNCDYYQASCAMNPSCGIISTCSETITYGPNLLDVFQVN